MCSLHSDNMETSTTGKSIQVLIVLPLKPLEIQRWDFRTFAHWAAKIKHKCSLGGHIPNCWSWLNALKRQREFLCYWRFTITNLHHLHLHARSTETEGETFPAHPISNATVGEELLFADTLLKTLLKTLLYRGLLELGTGKPEVPKHLEVSFIMQTAQRSCPPYLESQSIAGISGNKSTKSCSQLSHCSPLSSHHELAATQVITATGKGKLSSTEVHVNL